MNNSQCLAAGLIVSICFVSPMASNSMNAQEAQSWLQWRGPNRDGHIAGADWPDNLKKINRIWRTELGPSYSGPIVTADRVFVTETKDRAYEVVHAFDRKTGDKLWSTKWKGSMSVPFFASRNGSWIRSTPAYDGERLYVAGMRDVLVCLSGSDGKELWRFDFVKNLGTPLPSFGFACSPLLDKGHVYVQAGASLVKLDKVSGKIIWRSLKDSGGMNGSAFSSPTFAKLAGKKQLIVQTRTTLAGIDADTGKTLWAKQIPTFRGMNILTPTVYEDGVFTSSYGGKSFFISVQKESGSLQATTAWTDKNQGYMSSPVVVGNCVYIHLRNQRFACLDLKTGKLNWMTDQRFGQYWSMVVQGDRILALDQRGKLFLIRANPSRFDLLDQRDISRDETWAHLAVVDDQILVRELNAIAVYRWR